MTEQHKMKVRIVIRTPTGHEAVADGALRLREPVEHKLNGDDEPEGWNWRAIGAALALVAALGAGSWYWWPGPRSEATLAGDVALESDKGGSGVAGSGAGQTGIPRDSKAPGGTAGREQSEAPSTSAEAAASAIVETGTPAAAIDFAENMPPSPEIGMTGEMVVSTGTTDASSAGVQADVSAAEPQPEQSAAVPGNANATAATQLPSDEPLEAPASEAIPDALGTAAVSDIATFRESDSGELSAAGPPTTEATAAESSASIDGNSAPSQEPASQMAQYLDPPEPASSGEVETASESDLLPGLRLTIDESMPALAYAAPSIDRPDNEEGLEEILSENLTRAQLSWGVYRREPTVKAGATVEVPGPGSRKIYFFTEVSGLRGQTLRHRWLYEGETVATVQFRVGGDRWRVHSNKNLSPSKTGNWEVLVEDANGEPLGRRRFRVETGRSAG